MGRRKIEIKFINDDRNRSVTFIKRKNGLFKKAHELSILTGAKVTVHVEDIKDRQFDYKSANLGGDQANFQSDEEDDEHTDGHEESFENGNMHESTDSQNSPSVPSSSRRESTTIKPGHRRTQSNIHLSPNPGFTLGHSRRASGQPYPLPRSPNTSSTPQLGHSKRPTSMDLSMTTYGGGGAGGPQRKFSIPSASLDFGQQLASPRQVHSNTPYGQMSYQSPQSSQQMYYQPNSSQQSLHQALSAYDSPQLPSLTQNLASRYNGNLFQANGHPATHSQQHLPTYPSNLGPPGSRSHSGSLVRPDSDGGRFEDIPHGTAFDYQEEDMNDPDFDAMATQASTPGNYDLSTNTSMTNLNVLTPAQQSRKPGIGLGLNMSSPVSSFGTFQMPHNPMQLEPIFQHQQHPNQQAHQAAQQQQQQHHQQQFQQQQQQQSHNQQQQQQQRLFQQQQQQRNFYANASGAQSTPNLAWSLGMNQTSPQRR